MATDNQLRARVSPTHAEHISDLAESRFEGKETEAEREVVKQGLASLGYVSRPVDGPELLLYYVRFIGLALGLAGLASMALGVFWGQMAGVYGFGLLTMGFLIVVTADAIRLYGERKGPGEGGE